MPYIVTSDFQDGKDGRVYRFGEEFDVTGSTKSRIELLLSTENALGYPVIALEVETPEVAEDVEPKKRKTSKK